MTNSDDFSAVRGLCEDYYQQRLTKEEYRLARAELLSKIDRQFNANELADDSFTTFVDKIKSIFTKHDEEKMT